MYKNGGSRFHKARSRSVPPPGAIASASLPGYRRAGWGAGRVDPLPPAAPPQPNFALIRILPMPFPQAEPPHDGELIAGGRWIAASLSER